MVDVIIYATQKVATQSGKGKKGRWCVEFLRSLQKKIDPLTGWCGSKDPVAAKKLYFKTCDQATRYCENNHLQYRWEVLPKKTVTPKSYADNFLKFR